MVHGTRAITVDTALRLARYFGTSERFWMNLQTRYDLEIEKDELGGRQLADKLGIRRHTPLGTCADPRLGGTDSRRATASCLRVGQGCKQALMDCLALHSRALPVL
jgi:hypothetical protein